MVDKEKIEDLVQEELLEQPGCEAVMISEELRGEIEEIKDSINYILDFLEIKFGELTEE